jgi:hypothetical protein
MARLAEVGVSLTSLQPHATPNDVLIDVIQSQKEIIDNQSESIQIQSVQLDELEVRVEAADEFVEVANETIMSYADEVKNANSLLKELTETNKALRFHLERKGVDSDDYDFVDPDRTLRCENWLNLLVHLKCAISRSAEALASRWILRVPRLETRRFAHVHSLS